jgi:hypothetical protein
VHGRSTHGIEPTKLNVSEYGLDLRLKAQEDGFIELAFPKTIIDGAGVYGISREDFTTSYPHPSNNVTTNSTHNIVKQFIPKDAWAAHLKGTFMATNATPNQLVECEQLGIEPEICTDDAILAKRQSMDDPPMPPVVSGQLLTFVAQSPSKKYEAYVEWYHGDIGSPNSFVVRILDPNHPAVALSVYSDVRIFMGDEYIMPSLQVNDSYNFILPEPGSYTMMISIIEFNDNRERIEIPIQVTPELPATAGLSAVLVGSVIAAIMVTRTRLFANSYPSPAD